MSSNVSAGPRRYFTAFARLLEQVEVTTREGKSLPVDEGLGSVATLIGSLRDSGAKALLIGNGGSAAIVSHMHNDLCKSVGVRAIVFNDAPLLTAVANDHGYHTVFHRPVELWADRHDVLIAVSSSGESENIVKAASLANDKGCRLVTFTGFRPTNRLRQLGQVNVYVPASDYGFVEMAHSVIAHCVTDIAVTVTASV
ncbi:MAG TPA: SIS domain-containing protein [Vicinamibacterales bacterium]|jgi:D-sedoheptulose 7-phosphate isomerase|nr:SIS domain-containing protein [Vicinamibacterales bacterium]